MGGTAKPLAPNSEGLFLFGRGEGYMQVLKFGGTSVNDAKAISQVVSIVADQRRSDDQVAVVTSAMRGVTDLLIDSANAAAWGDRQATGMHARR